MKWLLDHMIYALTFLMSFLALVVSSFSLFVSAEKLRLELYNKRFDIYMRTVKFYQALRKCNEIKEDEAFAGLKADFIIASREAKFLFSPESGVYDLLSRLNAASSKITGFHDLPRDSPQEPFRENQREYFDAFALWNSSIEPLEELMAKYLDYHYASTPSALFCGMRSRRSRLGAADVVPYKKL
jgi:hypothetical protein